MEDLQQEDVEIQSVNSPIILLGLLKRNSSINERFSQIFILQIIFTRLQLKKKGENLGIFFKYSGIICLLNAVLNFARLLMFSFVLHWNQRVFLPWYIHFKKLCKCLGIIYLFVVNRIRQTSAIQNLNSNCAYCI